MLWLVKNALSTKMSHFSFQSSVDPQHIQNIDAVRRSMKTPSRVRFEIGSHCICSSPGAAYASTYKSKNTIP